MITARVLIHAIFASASVALASGCGAQPRLFSTQSYYLSGDTMYIRPGRYLVSTPIRLPAVRVIEGAGAEFSVPADSRTSIMEIVDRSDLKVSSLTFSLSEQIDNSRSPEAYGQYNHHYLVVLRRASRVEFSDCTFRNALGTTLHITDSRDIRIRGCAFRDLGATTYPGRVNYSYDGIFVGGYGASSGIEITGCEFTNIGQQWPRSGESANDGDGIQLQSAGSLQDVIIQDCHFTACSARGVKVMGGSDIRILNNRFTRCRNPINFAMTQPVRGALVRGNRMEDCKLPIQSDCVTGTPSVDRLEIVGNEIDTCYGFLRTSGASRMSRVLIADNRIGSIHQYFAEGRFLGATFRGNVVDSYGAETRWGYHHALYLNPESVDVHIVDNIFTRARPGSDTIIVKTSAPIEMRGNEFPLRDYQRPERH